MANVVDVLINMGLLRALEWIFSNDLLLDQNYSGTTAATGVGAKGRATVVAYDTVRRILRWPRGEVV